MISLSVEAPVLGFASKLSGARHYATAHNYYLLPFGPFRRFATDAAHSEMLLRLDCILCPCVHHCEFLTKWGPPGLRVRPLYAADYAYASDRDSPMISARLT